ncbi:MAG: hypothetical protein [Bacteriophage sp.]|nr:MAG: hypothetical protein [Bacteriophage sp.]
MARRKDKTIQELLALPDKGVREADDVLTTIYRTHLLQFGVTPNAFIAMIERYLSKKLRGTANEKNLSSARSNLMSAISENRMTWKLFSKGLDILPIKAAGIAFTVVWYNDRVTRTVTTLKGDPYLLENVYNEKEDQT